VKRAVAWILLAAAPLSSGLAATVERYRLHEHVQEEMSPPAGMPKEMRVILREGARAELEAASAATSPDVRLRFDLGEVYEALDRHEEALAVLRPALAMAPDHSAASRAWLSLAFAAAKLDRSREEIAGYEAFLARALDDDPSVLANRAEAEMRLGNLDEAVAGYRDVIDRIEHGRVGASVDARDRVLARWGLVVALDRLGNSVDAAREALLAVEEDPREEFIGDQELVFFVPSYERDWYYGVGRIERARLEADPRRALAMWTLVVDTWADYLQRATPDDRWRPLARLHLASAEAERRAVAGRVPPTRPAPPRASSSPSGAR
jgi:tetratricopeptide (TPR) repeat protein